MWLGSDEPSPFQDPPDRGHGRYVLESFLGQVEVESDRAGVEAGLHQLTPKGDDPLLDLQRRAMGDVTGSARAWADRLVAALAEAAHHLAHPALRHPVGACHLPVASALHQHRLDDVARQIHRIHPFDRCPRCSDTGVHDVVNSHT